MKKQYYYLVSSLYDLTIDTEKLPMIIKDFTDFCSEEMTGEDFENLKNVFLFNDIKNAINNTENKPYILPSYYAKEEFEENLKDTDLFKPFMADYFYNKKTGKRLNPELLEIDELTLLLYIHLDEFKDQFIKDYFLFEIDLRNITTALALKKNSLPYAGKIIPYGDIYEQILKSNSPDFGLAGTVSYLNELLDVYKDNDLINIEKTIESIRWKYLDEAVAMEHFSVYFVIAQAIKLCSIERWANMKDEKGEEVIRQLIEQIKSSIKFSEEF